jgi:hypothetical protein
VPGAAAQNAELVQEWAVRIDAALRMQPQRPSMLLVVVNPFGGARRARRVWHRVAHPIFNSAGVPCSYVPCFSFKVCAPQTAVFSMDQTCTIHKSSWTGLAVGDAGPLVARAGLHVPIQATHFHSTGNTLKHQASRFCSASFAKHFARTGLPWDKKPVYLLALPCQEVQD